MISSDGLLGNLLAQSADRWPDKTALVFPEARVTYRELFQESLRRGAALRNWGIQPGEHVGILLPNSADFLYWLFGCALHGSVAVLINARYKSEELAYVVEHADLCGLITSGMVNAHQNYPALLAATFPELSTQTAGAAPGGAPLLRGIMICGNGSEASVNPYTDEQELLPGTPPSYPLENTLSPESACLMLYTSGTTSNPKGCLLSHGMLTGKTAAIVERLAFQETDCQWNPLPLFHLASIMPMLASFATGGCYLTDRHFDPGRAWQQILAEQATILYPAFPTIMSDLVNHPGFADLNTRQVRLINNVAPPDRLRENQRLLPHSTHISAYGLTEGTGISCYSHLDDDPDTRTRVIGRPLGDTRLRIVHDGTGEPCQPGEQGEIQLSGPSVFKGYYKMDNLESGAFTEDGWFRTGDIGTLDEDGRLAFHGRLKDTLKVGGENVAALEIESLLSRHPAVKMVQVVGAPDERLDEVVAAFVERVPGTECSAEELMDYCRERVASFKVPRYVRFVSEWPMSATKVQKFRLKDQLLSELTNQ